MGMLIEDCIKELLINKEDDTYVLGNETIDFAISTMRKYQKIQAIVKAWNDMNSFDSMYQISKVVKNGNDD